MTAGHSTLSMSETPIKGQEARSTTGFPGEGRNSPGAPPGAIGVVIAQKPLVTGS
jgi:hypothetical protein